MRSRCAGKSPHSAAHLCDGQTPKSWVTLMEEDRRMTQQMFFSFSLTSTDQLWWHLKLRFILFTRNHSRTQIYSAVLQILNPDALKQENDKTSFKMIPQQPDLKTSHIKFSVLGRLVFSRLLFRKTFSRRIKMKYFTRFNPFK